MLKSCQGRSGGAFLFLTCIHVVAPPAAAQTQLDPLPLQSALDENNVDLANWDFLLNIGPISIGPPDQNPIVINISYPSERDSFTASLKVRDPSGMTSTRAIATVGGKSWSFIAGGATDRSAQFVLEYDAARVYAKDGSVIEFEYPSTFFHQQDSMFNACAAKITKLDGEILTFYNKNYVNTASGDYCRTQSIISNRGYQIKYEYSSPTTTWRTKVTLINNSYELCEPLADTCSLAMPWPFLASMSGLPRQFSNHAGQTWTLTANGIIFPGDSVASLQYTGQYYVAPNITGKNDYRVTSVTRLGQTWTYSYPSSDALLGGGAGELMSVQDPLGNVTRYRRALGYSDGTPDTGESEAPNLLWKSVDALGRLRSYQYNPQSWVLEVQLPEGNKHLATYDDGGNQLTHTVRAKPGSGLPDITASASFPSGSCTWVTCSRPLSSTDARGSTTDFTYDPTHGGVLTETLPAGSNGIRPVKRYAYSQHYAWVKNSGGGYVQAASPIWMLDSEKLCRTSATVGNGCAAGSSDEVIVTYDYGPNSGPNNLWLRGKVVTADGVSLRTCYDYDKLGNKIWETTPRAAPGGCY